MKHPFMKLLVLLLALSCLLLAACVKNEPVAGDEPSAGETGIQDATTPSGTGAAEPMPWDAPNAKQPQDYTWEEYEALTEAQKKAFRQHLGVADFSAWLEQAETQDDPWDLPDAKQPMDYTWAEYQALTEAQKKAFMEQLGPYGLEAWLQKVQDKKTEYPWDTRGAKQPKDYTWAEYQALSKSQQVAFVDHLGASGFQKWLENVQGQKVVQPWEKPGAKPPRNYTWEEYEALTQTQKQAFRDFLGTEGFNIWLEWALKEKNPWEESGAKQPQDYTWEEYQALTETQKVAFQEKLGADAFEAWLQKVLQQDAYPWEEPGAKQPQDYTWAEYTALTETQQAAFQDHLGAAGLDTWLRKVTAIPWEKPGAKQPKDYTLQEYEKLTLAQQLAFRLHLGTEGFEEWLLTDQSPKEDNPWEKPGAKQPNDYTWEEFSALTIDQQIAFQNYLGDAGFEAWLNKVQSQMAGNPWEKPGAKQPADYTWAEFEALTAEQQMAFQNHLTAEGFEAWREKAQSQSGSNPWEAPGAKQPNDYTWAEFEALTGEQQIAFQNYLGAEKFDAWMNRVLPE